MNQTSKISSRNIIETVLVVVLLIGLLVSLYEVLNIFFGVLMFAMVFATSFRSFYEWLVMRIKNKRNLAAFLYVVLLIIIIIVPLGFLFNSISKNVKPVIDWVNNVKQNGLPPLPPAIAKIPLAGKEIAKLWNQYHEDPKQIISDHQQQVQVLSRKAMTSGINILQTMLELIIGIVISALLLVRKETVRNSVQLPFERLLGKDSAGSLLDAVAMSIRGVAIGVMGSAFIAAMLSFIGLEIAGIHFAVGLTAVVFFLSVIQVGPLPLWVVLIIWMTTQDHPGKLTFLIIWGVVMTIIDAFVKPIVIGKSGGKLPFLVLFLGVIGGLAAWGFTGMFEGAIILAVFYTVYNSWIGTKRDVKQPG